MLQNFVNKSNKSLIISTVIFSLDTFEEKVFKKFILNNFKVAIFYLMNKKSLKRLIHNLLWVRKCNSFLSLMVKKRIYNIKNEFISFYVRNKRELSSVTNYKSGEEKNKLIITPAVIYHNAKHDKKAILMDSKGRSGIYRWTNILTEKFYIGSAVELSRRLQYYYDIKYMTSYKGKSAIYLALLKNGHTSFKFDILEYCNKENVISREQYYIDLLKPDYNILKMAGSSLGFRHSKAVKANMSINNTGVNHPFFGKKHTEESKVKMSLSSKLVKAVIITDVDSGLVEKFRSNTQAAKHLNISEWTIRAYKKNKRLYKNKYLIEADITSSTY